MKPVKFINTDWRYIGYLPKFKTGSGKWMMVKRRVNNDLERKVEIQIVRAGSIVTSLYERYFSV